MTRLATSQDHERPRPQYHIISDPAINHTPLNPVVRQQIFGSAQATIKVLQDRDRPLESQQRDPLAEMKWRLREYGSRNVNLADYKEVITQAADQAAGANSKKFFTYLAKLFQTNRDGRDYRPGKISITNWFGLTYLQNLLLTGWIGAESDAVDIVVVSSTGFAGRLQSLGLCFFTDDALANVASYVLDDPNGKETSLDGIKKARQRLQKLGLKGVAANHRIINYVQRPPTGRNGEMIVCKHRRR